MKKIIGLSLVLLILSVAASAQGNLRRHRPQRKCNTGQVTMGERAELRQDAFRYRMLKRRSQRDGVVTSFEKRRLQRSRAETRRDAFRFRHNTRRRLI